ncbi:hypothetical protein SAMN04487988_11399 [Algoriphagus hitonicola]|uniref:Uncharacterized protein n=1 Tax=Algoriphagus hitonicola TaxID=435880 RepID=A0A1I2WMW5_9BACT|nr:hypothetical protein SAMN04487988_11399 [Algoriphagus hitonicola]
MLKVFKPQAFFEDFLRFKFELSFFTEFTEDQRFLKIKINVTEMLSFDTGVIFFVG